MNPYLYNPAYAGVEGHSVLFVMYHQQWSNFEDSPSMVHASFHTPLRGGIGIGATAYNISQGGLLNRSIGKVSGSYLLTIDRKHYVRFGMSIGGGTQSVNFDEIDDPSDPAFTDLVTDNSFAIADFGVTYHFDHFNVGFSIPNLVSYNTFQTETFAEVRVNPLDNLILKMNYRGHINNDIAIEPHLLYRYSRFSPDQYEATVIAHIYHIVWVGLTYRQENNFIATFGTKIKEKIGIGYAYEMGNTDIRNFLGPTHEVHIGYHLGTKKDHAEHVSSFIKSHRLSAEERARQAALERQRAEAARERQNEEDQLGIIGKPDSEPQVAEEPPIQEEEPLQEEPEISQPEEVFDWVEDNEHKTVTRTTNEGKVETPFIITHANEAGQKEYAMVWKPAGENWEIIKEGVPEKRTLADGSREVKIKYEKTLLSGETETIEKWEPILNEDQLNAALTQPAEPVDTKPSDTEPTDTEPDVSEPEETQPEMTQEEEPEILQPIEPETNPEEDPVVTEVEEPVEDEPTKFQPENGQSHDEVTRGNHMLELPSGIYVIGGAFREFQNAENYSDDLFARGFRQTIVGYVSERKLYYTVIYRTNNMQEAIDQKARVSERPGMEDVWILKVN